MSIVRFDPFRGFVPAFDSAWVPAVDIFETEQKELVLKAELPDVKREDVSVTVENNRLTLSGERKLDAEVKQEHFRRIERTYGRFTRTFTLPTTVDTAKIAAEFKNGVLTIRLTYREEAKPRSINVEVAA
jgi:HSP20 family protein